MKQKRLPVEYIKSLLSYEKKTGVFIWKESRGTVAAGGIAGGKSLSRGKPYLRIKIDRVLYSAHRLAWATEHNEWPESIDHINGNGLDNRISNLRCCDMSQNKANSKTYKNNKSGAKGVFKRGDKFDVSIQYRGERIRIGMFLTLEEAKAAYIEAAKEYFGEYARAA